MLPLWEYVLPEALINPWVIPKVARHGQSTPEFGWRFCPYRRIGASVEASRIIASGRGQYLRKWGALLPKSLKGLNNMQGLVPAGGPQGTGKRQTLLRSFVNSTKPS
jgi:hypothetical protein